jgi:methylphosphotriester-DNA--protein-cysteine methyltransferase
VSFTLIGPDGRPYESSTPGTLGGHRRTKVYGRLDCPGALSLIRRDKNVVEHRVFFADEETAIAAGYRPCGTCMRDAYRAWRRSVSRAGAARASDG